MSSTGVEEMETYEKPQSVSDVSVAFPGSLGPLLPPMDAIPEDFRRHGGRGVAVKWCTLQSKWFFEGLKGKFVPRDGIDEKQALRHLQCIQGSFQPAHEHKAAAVAWLMSLWFSDYVEARK